MHSFEAPRGVIFDIQSFSVHDGPGCRTTVFLNGCPLKCRWCANPESWTADTGLLFSAMRCKAAQGCAACRDACPRGGLVFRPGEPPLVDRSVCERCTTFECTAACYHEALKKCGKPYTVEELMYVLNRDANHWRGTGGVTFSGGDPTAQHVFLRAALKECKKRRMHTAIETSAYCAPDIFQAIMQDIDFAFIDIKHMDDAAHVAKTGVHNALIRRNIAQLAASDWPGRLIIRMPAIGGYNDGLDHAAQVMEFMRGNGLSEINLLPFHRLGESKWNQRGLAYDYNQTGDVREEDLVKLQAFYLDHEIACYIGDDTLF